MDFGLDDWIYWHLVHTARNYRQYSAIAILHTLQFTVTHTHSDYQYSLVVYRKRINNSLIVTSNHTRILFLHSLQFLLSHLRLPSPELNPILDISQLKWALLQLNTISFWQLIPWDFPLYSFGADTRKKGCRFLYLIVLGVLLLLALASAGMCLPSRLTMGLYVTIIYVSTVDRYSLCIMN
jgi:hypothetical protein